MDEEILGEIKHQINIFKLNRSQIRERYPDEIRASVKQLYKNGASVKRLCRELGLSHDTIVSWVGAPKRAQKFKELKIKAVLPVEKPKSMQMKVLKADFEISFENLSHQGAVEIIRGL